MWQCESVHTEAREQRIALGDGEPTGIAAPGDGVGYALVVGCAGEADARPDRPGGRRDGGRREDRHDPEDLEGVAEDAVDVRPGLGLPRFVRLEVGVRLADEPPRR